MIKKNLKLIITLAVLIAIIIAALLLFFKPGEIETPYNIVFLLFDAVRADHLTPYGYQRDTSPAMQMVADDGVVFERMFSQSGWTLPSISSFVTGTYPDYHKTDNMRSKLNRRFCTFAEYLMRTEYQCVGASNSPFFSRQRRMTQGMRRWVDRMRDPNLTNYTISYLNPDNITYHHIQKETPFSDFSFRKIAPNLLEIGSRFEDGYFDDSSLKISASKLKEDKTILSVSTKKIAEGNYHWGLAVQAVQKPVKVELTLENMLEGNKVIATQEIEVSSLWEMKYAKIRIDSPLEKVAFKLRFKDKDDVSDILVDDLFMVKQQKRDPKQKRFIYLHYINPHEPHRVPDLVKDRYIHLFKDDILPDIKISNTAGDLFDLINAKYIIQKARTATWIGLNDRINDQNNGYDREIRYMDDQVKIITDYLKTTGQYDKTMILITADHGEEFLDHGHISHGLSLYNELLNIPFILSYPDGFPSGKRIKANCASIDFFPTIMELVNKPNPYDGFLKNQLQGRSFLPLITGKDNEDNRLIFGSDQFTNQISVIQGKWKLIRRDSGCNSREVLFDIDEDFTERTDLSSKYPEKVKILSAAIKKYQEGAVKYRARFIVKDGADALDDKKHKEWKKDIVNLGYLEVNKFDLSRVSRDVYCDFAEIRKNTNLLLEVKKLIF